MFIFFNVAVVLHLLNYLKILVLNVKQQLFDFCIVFDLNKTNNFFLLKSSKTITAITVLNTVFFSCLENT